MGLLSAIKREWFYTKELRRLIGAMTWNTPEGERLTPDVLEDSVDAHSERPAFKTERGEVVSYGAFDAYANQVAHWALDQGLKPGDTVALYMGNRWEYVAIWFGLSKVGVLAALINNQVTAQPLAHTLTIAETAHCIVEGELVEAYKTACDLVQCDLTAWVTDSISSGIEGAQDFDLALISQSKSRPDRSIRSHLRAKDPCMKMYTSGTTGLPKAAIVAHTRALNYLHAFGYAAQATEQDAMMMVLPLYHATGGLCGVGAALSFGGCLIVRRRFSASSFWQDASESGATMFMYVGELCRFLVAAEPHPAERTHNIRVAIGNGLRPDVWPRFVERSSIPRIIEFYGATEGNVALINLDSKEGSIGRVPPHLASRFNISLVRFDTEKEEVIRGSNGLAIACAPDEVGEAIGEIRSDEARYRFDGYQDEEATKKKILRDVFKKGDIYFRTGDLMRRDKLGYYYFVDRIGDTFRWKSENVSTNEVAEVLGVFEGVVQANVYGVEVADYSGKAGMAALVTAEGAQLDLEGLRDHVHKELPHYARPLYLRLHAETPEQHTTGTFKLKKTDLVKQGWDPAAIEEPLYVDDAEAGAYVPLTSELREEILSGRKRV